MIYDLRELEKEERDYTADGGDLIFNFCRYANFPGMEDTYAYLETDDGNQRLTSNAVVPQERTASEEKQLTTKQISNELCEDDKYYSFETTFVCNENISGQGNARILSYDTSGCNVKVTVAHEAACPIEYMQF